MPDPPYLRIDPRTGRNGGGPLRAGGAYHLFCEKRNHPFGDRVSVKPLWTSYAGGSGAGAFAGCKLCPAGFHTMPVNAAVSFHMEAGRASFFAPICERPLQNPAIFSRLLRGLCSILEMETCRRQFLIHRRRNPARIWRLFPENRRQNAPKPGKGGLAHGIR